MTESIYGMHYKIAMNGGGKLQFTKDNPWMEADLIAMEKRMLLSYPISRLLPLEITEMNLEITLAYKIGAKKSLVQLTQQETFKEVDCLRILLTIVTTLLDSKVHLLNENRYLLEESFVFIGTNYLDIHLIYLPIYEFAGKPLLSIELLNLLNFLLKKQGTQQSLNVMDIKELLNAADFQLSSLKEKLLKMITEIELSFPTANHLDHYSETPRQQFQTELNNSELNNSDLNNSNTQPPLDSWMPLTAKEKLENWRQRSSHNPLLVLGSIVSIGIVWLLYSYSSSTGMLNVCLGFSLLILNTSYRLNRSLELMDTGELADESPFAKSVAKPFPVVPMIDYYEQLGNHTTLLATKLVISDATVLLSPTLSGFLELKQGEDTQLIRLSSSSFIIGRNEEVAQFTADWLGLSRSHIMITNHGKDYEIKDLGSKNGSFLNEEMMIPHQNYLLNEGDCIKIVEKQFIYKKF